MISILMAMALQAAASPPAQPGQTFSLICVGSGNKTAYTSSSITVFNSKGGSATGDVDGVRDRPYSDNIRVEVAPDGTGKVLVPQILIPPMHGGGVDGWWTIQNLKVSDDQIAGQFSFNFMNTVQLRIYRTTGQIALSGKSTTFAGQCEKYHPEDKKF